MEVRRGGWERVLTCAVVGTRQKVMGGGGVGGGGGVVVRVRVRVRCVAWCDTVHMGVEHMGVEHMGVGVISWALMPTMF